ncbi:unnamed protein product [Haemonchus placei]|uniref:Uncharacterized protein n=1 Tax=Haemonchus placei TaxID=6290 RepID=A0A0N4VZM2_HAEPC|nr:unnamed protein product [Haemonchus placei]
MVFCVMSGVPIPDVVDSGGTPRRSPIGNRPSVQSLFSQLELNDHDGIERRTVAGGAAITLSVKGSELVQNFVQRNIPPILPGSGDLYLIRLMRPRTRSHSVCV